MSTSRGDDGGTHERGVPVEWVASIGSTQVELARRARSGAAEQALATTSQTAGHGRRGREWVCPPGSGLAMSVLLLPGRRDGWTWLPLLAGLAVVSSLDRLGVSGVSLKWPNDVLWAERKLGGLIAERVEPTASPSAAAFVVGVGLNLRSTNLPLGAVGADRAGARVSAEDVAEQILRQMRVWVSRWEHGDAAPAEVYRARCSTLGQRVHVSLPGGDVVTGRADGVDHTGRLVVESDQGARVSMSAGDVVHVRAA